jgi:hypothetical protein
MRRLHLEKGVAFGVPAQGIALFNAGTTIECGFEALAVGRFDAVMMDGGEQFHADRSVEILWTTIAP